MSETTGTTSRYQCFPSASFYPQLSSASLPCRHTVTLTRPRSIDLLQTHRAFQIPDREPRPRWLSSDTCCYHPNNSTVLVAPLHLFNHRSSTLSNSPLSRFPCSLDSPALSIPLLSRFPPATGPVLTGSALATPSRTHSSRLPFGVFTLLDCE